VSILGTAVCELGEGPVYEAGTDTLWWFDIVACRLHEYRFADARERIHALPMMASALAVVDADRHVLATEHGLYLRDVATGGLRLLAPVEADNPVTRSNDARVHPSGAFWFGTMGKAAETGAGSIYWYRAGEMRRLFGDITITNSICFSPAGDIGYFADTRKNIVWRVACDPATGLPAGDPAVFIDRSGESAGMDGSVCDAEGVVWNARWGAGTVDAYDVEGRLLRSLPVPARQVSCPAFVGADVGRLAVTTAWQGLDKAALAEDSHAGRTFLLDLPVRGRLDPPVAL